MNTIYYASVYVVRPAAGGHELLLGRRVDGDYMGGTWQLISGGIEPNETAWQAAVREVREETGLTVQELYRLQDVSPFYRSDVDALCVPISFCAIVAATAEVVCNDEHTELAWLSLDAAAGRLLWAGDMAGLRRVREDVLADSRAKPFLRILIDPPV